MGQPQKPPEQPAPPKPTEEPSMFELEQIRGRAWRTARYEELGYESTIAEFLATQQGLDWHAVARLLSRGCTHNQALKIVL